MLKLNEFILLKAVFNEELHNAVLTKDQTKISEIVNTRYQYELNIELEPIDVNRLYSEHKKQLKNDNFDWAK
ncbi:hypothetical protein [Paenibacillus cremeus]|uniref:Uncharacterized protein n=1 Tax=Paenibacillus cremeus TaxID=2163881 RepID=A0A559KCV7_9BACL|nr:hypothetical protein [Paenibacillus cremeus]TVY09929.1 hypothetical protein FPZ49_11195 [Paenibacillus cremeus]